METDRSIEQVKQELAKNLQSFRSYGCSIKDILGYASKVLVEDEVKKFQGNQSKAAISLGLSRGTFRKILNRLESEKGCSRNALYKIEGGM